MSLMIQNSNVRESSMVSNVGKVYSKEFSVVSKTNQIEKMSSEEELAVFKNEFYEELSKINPHNTVSNGAVNISKDAFKRMHEEPAYKDQILNLIKRDFGDSYAPRNCSVLITVGSTLNDYRADSWPVIADSEFDMRSQNSFYKKTNESKKEEQKELMEAYLQKRQEMKRIQQEIIDEKIEKENDMRESLRKSEAEKAYNNQILYRE